MRKVLLAAIAAGSFGATLATSPAQAVMTSVTDTTAPTAFGVSVNGSNSASRFTSWTGRAPGAVRVFYNSLPARWTINAPAGAIVSYSFETATPAQVLAFERSKPAAVACTATFAHEPEADRQWNTASGHVAYRAKWATYARAIRAGGCTPTLILMKWTISSGSHRNWKDYYNPSAIDLLGFDAYNPGNKNGGIYTDPAKIIDPIAAVAHSVGKPWGLGETGSPAFNNNYAARAAWVTKLAAEIRHPSNGYPGARFADWWDANNPATGFDARLDPLAARAWH